MPDTFRSMIYIMLENIYLVASIAYLFDYTVSSIELRKGPRRLQQIMP